MSFILETDELQNYLSEHSSTPVWSLCPCRTSRHWTWRESLSSFPSFLHLGLCLRTSAEYFVTTRCRLSTTSRHRVRLIPEQNYLIRENAKNVVCSWWQSSYSNVSSFKLFSNNSWYALPYMYR